MTKFDERYGAEAFFYGTEPNSFLVSTVEQMPAGGTVLTLGEGEGRNAVWLAQQGFQVHAIDESAVGLAKAERLAAERGVSISTECADLADVRIEPGRWDVILSIWCHVASALRRRLHGEAARALRPGGLFVLEAYTPAQIGRGTGGPSSADLMPTAAQLDSELHGLEVLRSVELEREVLEGQGHRGHSAVVQWVGRQHGGAR
jgi:SAM-dependent methyltransferase